MLTTLRRGWKVSRKRCWRSRILFRRSSSQTWFRLGWWPAPSWHWTLWVPLA